jgi:delta1-piperideine-2-carboxylate reductase
MSDDRPDVGPNRISVEALMRIVEAVLAANGFSQPNACVLAGIIVAAERDGSKSHGLFRLKGYLAEVAGGWADGAATPVVEDKADCVIRVDARNGYCQPAYRASRDLLVAKTRKHGLAALSIRNSHHLAALWHEVEDLAEAGLVGLAYRNGRSHVVPWGGRQRLLGTNPMAFACPGTNGPLVWDLATALMARGEIMLAAEKGESVPGNAGVDRHGMPTSDPRLILDGGAQLAFGGHKGSLISLMIEVMAGALTGSLLSYEDRSGETAGAQTSKSGELIVAIDPSLTAGDDFCERVDALVTRLRESGARVPGEARRTKRRDAEMNGIAVDPDMLANLKRLTAGS